MRDYFPDVRRDLDIVFHRVGGPRPDCLSDRCDGRGMPSRHDVRRPRVSSLQPCSDFLATLTRLRKSEGEIHGEGDFEQLSRCA